MKKVIIIVILIFFGCKNQDEDRYNKISIKSIRRIDEFKLDTSKVFVYLPLDISYQTKQDRYYFIMNGLVYVFDKNFNCIKKYGKEGPGPEEFYAISKMYVKEDKIYLAEAIRNNFIEFDYVKDIINKWKLSSFRSSCGFSVDEDNIVYIYTPYLDNAVSGFSIPDFENPKISFNIPSLIDKEKGWYKDSSYHVLSTNNQVIAVSQVYPYIFFFDKKGNLTYTFTFPEELTSRMKFALKHKRKNPDNILKDYVLVGEAYLFNNRLYLLISENRGKEEEWFCNKIVVISIEDPLKPKIESTIELEGSEYYMEICVNQDKIIASTDEFIDIYKNPIH